ncbi:hypothetical protein OROHE_023432 [Orobanche hederae]
MEDIFVAVMMMVMVFSLIPLYFWRRRLDSRRRDQHEEEPQDIQAIMDSVTSPRTRIFFVRATNTRRMRRRPAASSAAASTSSTAVNVEGYFFFSTRSYEKLYENEGKSRNDEPLAMFLYSDDIVLMSGEARDRFHGMPRIFTDAEYAEIESLEKVLSDEDDICYLEYIKTSRININSA